MAQKISDVVMCVKGEYITHCGTRGKYSGMPYP
jgi:hypothetical protein